MLWLVLAATWSCSVIDAKHQIREVQLLPSDPNGKWRYVGKFSYGHGTGRSSLRFRLANPGVQATIAIEIYLDEGWPEVEAIEDVCARRAKSKLNSELSLPADGSWTDYKNNTYHQTIRPHVWYFAISLCSNTGDELNRVIVDANYVQDDGSHFSYESRWELTTNVCALLFFILFSCRASMRCVSLRRTNGKLHPVIAVLGFSILLELAGHSFHTWHLWEYSNDGIGLPVVEVVSDVASILSQVLLSTLLIMIAWGYTLTRSKVGDLDIFVVVSVFVALVHVVLVIVGKYSDDEHYKFHEHEGFHGWSLFSLRFFLFAIFLWACRSSMQEEQSRMQLQHFLSLYLLAGSCYFLTYPIMFLVIRLFAPYLQNFILQAGLVIMQVASIYSLAAMFLSRDSLYFQASALNRSELPRRKRSVDNIMPSQMWSNIRGRLGGRPKVAAD